MQTVDFTFNLDDDLADTTGAMPSAGRLLVTMGRHSSESPWHVLAADVETLVLCLPDGQQIRRHQLEGAATFASDGFQRFTETLTEWLGVVMWDRYAEQLQQAADEQYERDRETNHDRAD